MGREKGETGVTLTTRQGLVKVRAADGQPWTAQRPMFGTNICITIPNVHLYSASLQKKSLYAAGGCLRERRDRGERPQPRVAI